MECIDKYVSPFVRTGWLILDGDASHFTTLVLQEIIKCRNALDVANFDDEKTASVARQFARQYVPSMETVNELKEVFRPVKDLWKTDRMLLYRNDQNHA